MNSRIGPMYFPIHFCATKFWTKTRMNSFSPNWPKERHREDREIEREKYYYYYYAGQSHSPRGGWKLLWDTSATSVFGILGPYID